MKTLMTVCVGAALTGGLAFGPTRAAAQNPPGDTTPPAKTANLAYRYRLLGVFDARTGEAVVGAEVSDVLSGTKMLTSNTGTVSLFFLPDGGSLVRIRKLGYEVQTMPVAISPADTTPLTIVLSPTTTLPTVHVTDSAPTYVSPMLRGFEARRKQGFGHFVTEDQFRKEDGKPLSYVLPARMPGITTVFGPRGQTFIVSSRKPCQGPVFSACRQPDCYVSVYQDGVKVYDASMGPTAIPDFARMSTTEYAGAEFYAGGAVLPPEINGTSSGCGTLLLWTRER